MSDFSEAKKAIRSFEKHYDEGAGSFDFQRPNDRGLPPTGRQDPDTAVSFRAAEGEGAGGRGIRLRCAKCAAMNEVSHEALGEAGYTYGGTEEHDDLGADDGDNDEDVDPADTDEGNGGGN